MELTKEKAKKNLSKLIAKFEKELAAGRIKDYLEEATKISFIQPLLEDVLRASNGVGLESGNL